MGAAYLGTRPAPREIELLLAEPQIAEQLVSAGCKLLQLGDAGLADEAALLDQVSSAITEGLVVGWFEGRMEWGPRALGHRSILGDPRRADMKDILNLKIKRRESFRPFAPSVLQEAAAEWFELASPADADVPYMMQVYPIREVKRPLIPAVTHRDGSGRLQTVTEADNGRYYRLIHRFFERTGVPMVLNTSFNENEPIVCTPHQALACFLRTKMDVLVLGDVLVRREG
jgi:carbamoyltransferase